jgi:hypothetical protein
MTPDTLGALAPGQRASRPADQGVPYPWQERGNFHQTEVKKNMSTRTWTDIFLSMRPRDKAVRKVYFYRDFRFFTGGHLKVYHYFRHLLEAPGYEPFVYFTPESRGVPGNPWDQHRQRWLRRWEPEKADMLFLAGMDWQGLPAGRRTAWPVPIVNLIQHVRHGDPAQPPYEFLSCKAVRICLTQDVSDAIRQTGRANGPVHIVPNGIDSSNIQPFVKPWQDRAYDVLIAGLKQPVLARSLEQFCFDRGIRVKCLTKLISRDEYLALVGNSRTAVFLPRATEGYYLPPLEGMVAGSLVVCPRFIGNTGFYQDGVNCLQPPYDEPSIWSAIQTALSLAPSVSENIRRTAQQQVTAASAGQEKSLFLDIVDRADQDWIHS